jgi:hypothetical protein
MQLFNLVKPGIPATALRFPGFHPSIPGSIFLDFDLIESNFKPLFKLKVNFYYSFKYIKES